MGFADYWRLARPGNATMAALGVVVGGVLAADGRPDGLTLSYAALAAAWGVAGGNALNDVRDAAIDRDAHPDRPVAQRRIAARDARAFGWTSWIGAAALAFLAGPAAGTLAIVLVGALAAYEFALKDRGAWGNIVVSLVVGGTFVLGAIAARSGRNVFDLVVAWSEPGFRRMELLAVVAVLANVAREIFKDVEDLEADRGRRRTLPMRIGVGGAMGVARGLLVAAVASIPLLPWLGEGAVPWPYAFLVVPGALFVGALTRRDAGPAQRWTKAGMAAALVAFVAIGII